MKTPSSSNKIVNPAVIVSIVTIFLILIGFNIVFASIVSKAFGQNVISGQLSNPYYQIFFNGMMGLWVGWRVNQTRNMRGVLASSLSGALAGAIVGAFCLFLGIVYVNGADFRSYLTALSPINVNFMLYGLPPISGFLVTTLTFVVFAFVGGLLKLIPLGRIFSKPVSAIKTFIQKPVIQRTWHNRIFRVFLLILGITAAVVLPRLWGSYWNYVIGTVGIYVLMGLGLNLIVGLSGQLVLGFAAFIAVGAYTAALLNAPEPHNLMWGSWIAFILGIIIAAFAGALIGLPIMKLRGDYLAIVTLGFGEIMRIMLKSDLLTSFTGGPRGIQDIKGPVIFGAAFNTDTDYMYLILIAVALAVFITIRLQDSRVGRAWISMREDETVASASGVNPMKYKILALVLGAAFAGLAGTIFATRNQFTGPEDHTLMVSINALAIVIVGGMGSIPGIILGAFALKGLPELLREFESYRMLAFGALLVAMMIWRPQGFWPAKRPALSKRIKPGDEPPPITPESAKEVRHD
jgi:ABC-type branched-subunit amino acid transport system permease subunit